MNEGGRQPDHRDRRPVRLPHGVRDYLPAAAARRRGIAEALLAEFERWGYRRIVTPAFEYEAVLARGLGPEAQARAVRFVEPGTGEVVMLRPDITPQVARLVATRLSSEVGPIRLAYEGAVIRLSHGGQREVFQAGVELLDAPSVAADVEVVALAAASLRAAGIRHFTLDLGEASLARAALDGIAAPEAERLKAAIAQKNVAEVARLAAASPVPAWRRRLLEALPSLYGGPEVIDRAAALLGEAGAAVEEVSAARAGLLRLQMVVERLKGAAIFERDEQLSVDLGEVRGFDYYTGVRLQGYAPGVGDALLSGGRYDGLLARYGRAAGAAGFAVDVESVALALGEPVVAASGICVAGPPEVRSRLAALLRRAGHVACEDLDEPATDEARLCEKARAAGLARLVLVDDIGASVTFLDAEEGTPAPGAGHRIDRARLEMVLAGRALLDDLLFAR